MSESRADHPRLRALAAEDPSLRLPGESTYDYVEQVLSASPDDVDAHLLAGLVEDFATHFVELARWRRVVVEHLAAALRSAEPGTRAAAARHAMATLHVWHLAAPELAKELAASATQAPPPDLEARARHLGLLLRFLELDASEPMSEKHAQFALERLTQEPIDLLFPYLSSLVQHWRSVWVAQQHDWLRAMMIAWIGRCEDGEAFVAATSRHLDALHPIPRRATWEFLGEMAGWFPSSVPESLRASELLDRATMYTDLPPQ